MAGRSRRLPIALHHRLGLERHQYARVFPIGSGFRLPFGDDSFDDTGCGLVDFSGAQSERDFQRSGVSLPLSCELDIADSGQYRQRHGSRDRQRVVFTLAELLRAR